MGIATIPDCAFANGGVAVKRQQSETNNTHTKEQQMTMIEARDHALRNDSRVKAAIKEGKAALAAQPARSTVYSSGDAFLRDFV